MSLVSVRRDGPVRTVTLTRGEKRNALNLAMLEALEAAFGEAPEKTDRVVVLRAEGPVFCAGMDLAERLARPVTTNESPIETVLHAIEHYPLPVVAVVQGDAIAGGNELALHCDFVVAASTALVLGFLYWRVGGVIDDEQRAVVEAAIRGLADDYARGATPALAAAVQQRLEGLQDRDAIYLLATDDGRRIAGNLAGWPPTVAPGAGWTTLQLYRTDRSEPTEIVDPWTDRAAADAAGESSTWAGSGMTCSVESVERTIDGTRVRFVVGLAPGADRATTTVGPPRYRTASGRWYEASVQGLPADRVLRVDRERNSRVRFDVVLARGVDRLRLALGDRTIDVDCGLVYGQKWSQLTNAEPTSVFLAEGSEVAVLEGGRVR